MSHGIVHTLKGNDKKGTKKMIAATMTRSTRILIAVSILFAAMFTTTRLVNAAYTEVLSDVEFNAQDRMFTAKLTSDRFWRDITFADVVDAPQIAWEHVSSVTVISNTTTHVTFSFPVWDSRVDDMTTVTVNASVTGLHTIGSIEKTPIPAPMPVAEETHGVIVSISGQTGDTEYDTFVAQYPTCTVLAVIDDANDPLSSFIYTRLSCDLTQAQIDNLPEEHTSILLITPRYTVNMPVIKN